MFVMRGRQRRCCLHSSLRGQTWPPFLPGHGQGCVSVTTNAWKDPGLSPYSPPALQLPADAHDTEARSAPPPLLSAAVPGTLMAVPQVPLAWLTTNAWRELGPAEYSP